VTSAVPALFISGTLDGRTPVANAEEVQRGFRNSAHVIIDGASHGDDLFLSTPAILENVLAFARQPHSRTVRVTVH
jgi:pimeloyl-ACP methyl ester carboxylesterase